MSDHPLTSKPGLQIRSTDVLVRGSSTRSMPPVTISPVLAALRQRTSAAHTELEAQINIPQVCRDAQAYRRLIEGFWGYYRPFEPVLQRIPGWDARGFHWSERSKIGFLREDLRALGLSAAEIEALPCCPDLPAPRHLAEAFGCAYVLEGSTLGGRHITGILQQTGIPPEARHFFASYGARVGDAWKEFCEMLARLEMDEAQIAAAVAAASQTFVTIGKWLISCR